MRTKIDRTCLKCGKTFKALPSEIRRGGGNYCSPTCWYSSGKLKGKKRTQWIKKVCIVCNKEYEVVPAHGKRLNSKYCSTKCRIDHWRGENNPNFRNAVIKVKCLLCGKEFKTGKHRLKSGRGRYCSHTCNAIAGVLNGKKKGTSIEVKMEKELISRGIRFAKQYPIWQAKTIPDFFIAPDMCVYCDGDYWHNRPGAKEKDANQNFILKFYGYKVFRFWEHEINKNVSHCVDTIVSKTD